MAEIINLRQAKKQAARKAARSTAARAACSQESVLTPTSSITL